jgi:putative ABC transport system ATP-binding protein
MAADRRQFPVEVKGLAMNVLDAVDLYRFYHVGDSETLALRGVSLPIAPGETVAVMGPSGSGKSTLLACLCGLDEPDGGAVDLLGRRLSRRPEQERAAIRAASIGVLLQAGKQFAHLSVTNNVRLQMRLARKPDEQRLTDLLEQVGLADRRHAHPPELSGGEAARAGLAVALANAPALLLADEPTAEVDGPTAQHLFDILLAALAGTATALVVATHDRSVADRLTQRWQMRQGMLEGAAQ